MRSSSFYEYVMFDLFGEIPGITSRSMFGGHSFYKDRVILGMIAGLSDGEKLYFKVGENNIKDYQEKSMEPFIYRGKTGKSIAMKYYEVPEEVMENRSELREWIEEAVEANKKLI